MEFFRAVPVLLLMVFAFFLLAIGNGPLSSFWCVVIALTLYNGSVLAEVFRAGINAVPRGQAEAAYAIGMRKSQVMTTVLLPQAVKIMLPAIISQMVVALKDTSLGYYILAPGLTAVAKPIYLEFGNQVPTAIVITGIYVAVNLVLTWIATLVQKRLVGREEGARRRRWWAPRQGEPGGSRSSSAGVGFSVTQSRISPSTTTVPSVRTPRTRTGRSYPSPTSPSTARGRSRRCT